MHVDPQVTVLMSAYNSVKYLAEAIESILSQSFVDFEFLIINDGSTDSSVNIISSYQDSRIRLIENEANIGLTRSLNKGMSLARGKYIARMDADDISLPNRLKRQVAFMERNSEVGVCGTWIEVFGDGVHSIWESSTDPDEIRFDLLFKCPISHPSVMIRKSLFLKYGLNYNQLKYAQDYDLWARCSKYFKLANIPEVLLKYRVHQKQIGKKHLAAQSQHARKIRKTLLQDIGVDVGQEELEFHETLVQSKFDGGVPFINKTEAWFIKQIDANQKKGKYPDRLFFDYLAKKYYQICSANIVQGLGIWQTYRRSPFYQTKAVSADDRFKLFLKCCLRRGRKKTF